MTKSERTREHDDAFWLDGETLIVREEPRAKPVYDLEERTARFGEAVIDFAKKIPGDPVTERVITQLIGLERALVRITRKPMTRFPNENS